MIVINNGMGVSSKEIDILGETDKKILKLLRRKEMYPMEIARELGKNEQTIYYHVKMLQKRGMIVPTRKAIVGGIKTTYFSLASESFLIRIGEYKKIAKVPIERPKIISDFVDNSKIIVGSPLSHGKFGNVSRDIESVADLSFFLGTFSNVPRVVTLRDTNVRDIKQNLIIVGGPAVNTIMYKINKHLRARFDDKMNIKFGRDVYKNDDVGLVEKISNPWSKRHKILVVAGKSYRGTRSAVIAVIKYHEKLSNVNIVQGYDKDSDGVIDDVSFLRVSA